MCGVVGHINISKKISLQEIEHACLQLKHRGPDDWNAYLLNDNVGLGHTRLSFLDLSTQGKQPMKMQGKDIYISFNGEIYNFKELKKELSSYNFQTETDTEVLLAAYDKWGMDMLQKIEGMFAFSLIDMENNKLYLVRDRFGIKPLYYFLKNDSLIFASELKALPSFNDFEKGLDWSSFCDYFVYRYVPSPKTIWLNTFKVKPAHYVSVDLQKLHLQEHEYWSPISSSEKSSSTIELLHYFSEHLEQSVMQHTVADVPVGSFLSGGYDSSAIVYLLNKNKYPVETFSIGFKDWNNSEDQYAEIVANYLGVENNKVIASKDDLSLLDRMPLVYDEPIADISITPTYLVSQLARSKVKAVMSGEGADELFVGYTWQKEYYNKTHNTKWWHKIFGKKEDVDLVPFYANAMAMGRFDEDELKKMLHPEYHQFINKDVDWFYRQHTKNVLKGVQSIQYLDMKCFMGELVLTKVDRASMANSLEARVPFLNHHLFEKMFQSNSKDYFKPDTTKFVLHEMIKGHLPQEILKRKKQGFVGPDSYYMDTEWYRKQLANSELIKQGIIRKEYVNDLLSKDYDWRIWKILIMENWFKQWMG